MCIQLMMNPNIISMSNTIIYFYKNKSDLLSFGKIASNNPFCNIGLLRRYRKSDSPQTLFISTHWCSLLDGLLWALFPAVIISVKIEIKLKLWRMTTHDGCIKFAWKYLINQSYHTLFFNPLPTSELKILYWFCSLSIFFFKLIRKKSFAPSSSITYFKRCEWNCVLYKWFKMFQLHST